MKYITLFLISIYQILLSPLLHSVLGTKTICRYEVSCSEYTKRSVIRFGVLKGMRLGFIRFLSCQPFGTIGK